jgi:hypothetical protein
MGNLGRPLLAALDSDKDGKVTSAEMLAGSEKFLKDFDKNGDGALDEREIQSGVNSLLQQRPGAGPAGPRPESAARGEAR